MSKYLIEKNTSLEIDNLSFSEDIYEFELEENAHLTYITFDNGEKDAKNVVKANLKKDSHLEIYNVVTSAKSSNVDQQITLLESGANVQIMNLFLMVDEAVLDSNIEIFHLDKHTESDLSNYAIAKNNAKIVMSNNATIKQGCSGSIAHQQAKGLTLSEASKIKALPNLFIDEYDVIANHACAIGSINKEDLFYLMSRGLSLDEASKIVVMGYVQPILDKITNKDIKEIVEKSFVNKLLSK